MTLLTELVNEGEAKECLKIINALAIFFWRGYKGNHIRRYRVFEGREGTGYWVLVLCCFASSKENGGGFGNLFY